MQQGMQAGMQAGMQVRLTVVDPGRTSRDVVVSGEVGTPLGRVTPGLLAAVGAAVPDNHSTAVIFHVGEVALPGAAVVGRPPLLDGAVLLLEPGRAGAVPAGDPASAVPDGSGHLLVDRRPFLRAEPEETVVEVPAEPDERPAPRLPWLVMLLPAAVSLLVAAVLRQPMFLLFALTSPALVLGQYLGERRSGRREQRERSARYAAELAEAEQAIARALVEDARLEEERLPPSAEVARVAGLPGGELWHRSPGGPGHLLVRLGRGAAPARVVRREGGRTERSTHPDVAVGLDLGEVRVLGIFGPGRAGFAAGLVGQVATWASPHDLRIESPWPWARWLPHCSSGAPLTLTVLDDAARLRRTPAGAALLARAQQADAADVVLCLAPDAARLPRECAATVELSDEGPALLRRRGRAAVPFRADLPGAGWAEGVARALAPLRDATPRPGAPDCPPLADLLARVDGVRVDDAVDLARHWRSAGPAPVATIGVAARGPVRLDLRRDGPHALIGGTTGAGKSELLLTLVTALAAGGGPDRISFLLVDYKGGAAFSALAGLPHVAGVITDLDAHLATRALASLRAELRHRERLLAGAGAVDLDAYRAGGGAGLPRLVVVVDEFRVLAEELPEFVTGLVRVAAVGRSLGVHLVLATQRPSGVVSPEIRANAALRIALRVRDAADSQDLIETADAATIPASAPGKAYVRAAAGALEEVQVASARAGRRPVGTPAVHLLDAPAEPAPEPPADGLAAVPAAMRAAADRLGLPPVRRPWLPALPDRVPLGPLLADADPDERGELNELGEVVLGRADRPDVQEQPPAVWSPGAGHLGVVGGPRSGRTSALVTVAHALAARNRADELHLYAIDAGGGLGRLAGLPHCGAVVPVDDADRGGRLVSYLLERMRGDGQPGAPVVLLVDSWESLTARWSGIDHGALVDQLVGLLRDGHRYGVHAVVTGGRSLLAGQVSTLLPERLVLRFADPADAMLAGVRAPQHQPAGRGMLLTAADPEPCEVQVAVPDFTIAPAPAGDGGPWRLRPLPDLVTGADLAGHGSAEPLRVPVGLGGDDAAPVLLDLDRPGVVVVHGPPGSGRTSTLAAIEAAARELGVPVVRPDRPADLDDPDAVLLIDDVARFTDPVLEDLVVRRIHDRPERPRVVIAAGPGEVVTAFRGLAAEARTSRTGIVLGHLTAADAGLLGLAAAHRRAAPPGRGTLVHGAAATRVQLVRPARPEAVRLTG